MESLEESVPEMLVRLRPVLTAVFTWFRVPEEKAGEILDESCLILVAKQRLRYSDPAGLLVRMVLDRCRRLRKEGGCEDPPE